MGAMVSPWRSSVASCICNFHLDLLRPELFWLDTARSTRSVGRRRYDISYRVMQQKRPRDGMLALLRLPSHGLHAAIFYVLLCLEKPRVSHNRGKYYLPLAGHLALGSRPFSTSTGGRRCRVACS